MNRIVRSKIANDAKKKYIKEGKKSSMIKKLSTKVRASRLNKLIDIQEEPNEPNEPNEFVLQLSDASTDEDSVKSSEELEEDQDELKLSLKEKIKKSRITPKMKSKTKAPKLAKDDLEYLMLQKEIEELKLQQLKQSKKASRAQKEVIDAKFKKPSSVNQSEYDARVEMLKNQLLVKF